MPQQKHKAMWLGSGLRGIRCLTTDYTVTKSDVDVEIPADENDDGPRERAFASAMSRKLNAVCRVPHQIVTASEAKQGKDSHIVATEWWREDGDPRSDARMFCGLTAVLFDDGSATPSGLEFYDPEAAESATCKRCQERWAAAGKPRASTNEVSPLASGVGGVGG